MRKRPIRRHLIFLYAVSIFSMAFSLTQWARAQGGPNHDLERRLHMIYQQAGQPVDEDRWAEMTGSRKDTYVIQNGDTLWDLSQSFFGDGFFWSKLWAENSSIQNPHKIVPEHGIVFSSGTESEAPSIQMTEEKVEVPAENLLSSESLMQTEFAAPVYADDIRGATSRAELEVEEAEVVPKPEIPPAKPTKPPIQNLPPSFVMPGPNKKGNYDSTGLDAPSVRVRTVPAEVIPSFFLLDNSPQGVGSIIEIEASDQSASNGQYVILQLREQARVGDRLSALYLQENIDDPVRGEVGPVVETGGILEITQVIDQAKGFYRATVTHAVNPIRKGSMVRKEDLPRARASMKGPFKNTEVRVLGGEFDVERKIFGVNAFIYLDGGSGASLQVGDILAVKSRRGDHHKDSEVPDFQNPIAVVRIVHVMPSVATALVLEAFEEIRPGDRTGGQLPKDRPKLKFENARNSVPME